MTDKVFFVTTQHPSGEKGITVKAKKARCADGALLFETNGVLIAAFNADEWKSVYLLREGAK